MFEQLEKSVNSFVREFLNGSEPKRLKGNKVIKDPVWGMTALTPLEINILDCPLVQRLRRVHQTGLSYLTYPSALHKRFDHSVGMLSCATKTANAINDRHLSRSKPSPFTKRDIQEIRLAAILHDVGHACLSHVTEPYFDGHPLIKHSLKYLKESKQVVPSNHELISSLIIRSEAFIEFFEKCRSIGYSGEIRDSKETLNHISDMVIGFPINGENEEAYKSELINGPYDSDKMDYIFRDSYFTGVALSTDLERFIYGLSVSKVPQTGRKSIVLDANAASTFDQLVFSKMALYTNVYNHQKILAVNQMVDNVLEVMKSNPSISINNVKFDDPVNFLKLSDWDFLAGETSDSTIKGLQNSIKKRDLLVRLFRLSPKTSIDGELSPKVVKIFEDKEKLDKFRSTLCRGLGLSLNGIDTIRVGIPFTPKFKELVDAYCRDFDNEILSFNEIFPIQWISSYGMNKWVAHLYGPRKFANIKNYETLKGLMEAELEMSFNDKAAPKFN